MMENGPNQVPAVLTCLVPNILISWVAWQVPAVSQSKAILSPLHQPRSFSNSAGQNYLMIKIGEIFLRIFLTYIFTSFSNYVFWFSRKILGFLAISLRYY
jgi:hypothetical protein